MLLELRVKDLGIIEDIAWRLGPGLNVITGETGAGKSLVIDALEALMTGKLAQDAIRHGADQARVEGVFLISPEGPAHLQEVLVEHDLAGDSLVISCDLPRRGAGIVRVNRQAIPRTLARQIGRSIVDLHGQSEHLSLLDRKTHLGFLDAFARTQEMRNGFAAKMTELRAIDREMDAIQEREQERQRREDFLRFQIEDIRQAGLQGGEEESLEKERTLLSFSEKLKLLCDDAYQSLYGGDDTALDRLNQIAQLLKQIAAMDPAMKPDLDFVQETVYRLEDLAREMRAYRDNLEHNPQRLEEVETRLDIIRKLKRKYGGDIPGVLEQLRKAEEELLALCQSTERRGHLLESRSRLRTEMGHFAAELSARRSEAAGLLASKVKKELAELDLGNVEFQVAVTRELSPGGILFPDGNEYACTADGADAVEFMVSTNPGEPLGPLARIASTGEMSRFTLALKGALSHADGTPVLVFDEIDIGVGGRSGEVIGQKMWDLARRRQVICVTHLAQVAVYADAHFKVTKDIFEDRTVSSLKMLGDEERVEELAVMLGGPQRSRASMVHAAELLKKVESWKQSRA